MTTYRVTVEVIDDGEPAACPKVRCSMCADRKQVVEVVESPLVLPNELRRDMRRAAGKAVKAMQDAAKGPVDRGW